MLYCESDRQSTKDMLKDTTRENRKQQVDEVHKDLLRNPKQGKTTGNKESL